MQYFEARQERAALGGRIEAIVMAAGNENRALTERDLKDLVVLRSEAGVLDQHIQSIAAKNTITGQGRNPLLGGEALSGDPSNSTQPTHGHVGRTTLQQAMQHATPEQREEVEAFASYLGGNMSALANLNPTSDGAVLIPQTIAGVVERNYSQFTPVVNVARLWPTNTGNPERFPVISDSEEAEQVAPSGLTGLDISVTGDTPITALTGPTLLAYKISSKPVFIPRETITDSTINVMEEIVMAQMARIYRKENALYTTGSGTGEAQGFLAGCSVLTSSTALNLDLALDLAYAVPQLYRPNGVYMCSDTTVKFLRKLKTGIAGDLRSLWKDAFEEGNATLGTPAKLHGYPLYINNAMDSVASDGTYVGVSPLAFGDFQKLVVRQAENGAPFIYRWPVPAKDGGACIAFRRSDSRLLVPEAIYRLAHSGS